MAERYKRYIDPLFYIPEGIPPEVWEHSPKEFDEEESPVIEDDDSDDSPQVVDKLTVVSQKIRRTDTGSVVVDIVVEVDDVPGATKYEFRISKT